MHFFVKEQKLRAERASVLAQFAEQFAEGHGLVGPRSGRMAVRRAVAGGPAPEVLWSI